VLAWRFDEEDKVQIILVSDRLATARTITVKVRHVVIAALALVTVVLGASSLFSFVTLRHAAEIRLPLVQNLILNLRAQEEQKTQAFLRENLNAMAVKLGQMQAQLVRLDTLGERVAGLVGIKPAELRPAEPGRGGPLIQPAAPQSPQELEQQVQHLMQQMESRGDVLGLIESQIRSDRVSGYLLPTTVPVARGLDASSYGFRRDPITGARALHTGVDFSAEVGTPIVAAAGGVVIAAEYHAEYGNMIDIDHGDELVTRYAHASKMLVKPGQVVKPGQKIAEVGSTGRSTGPHLHFEVRVAGVPQNPNRFLQRDRPAQLAARN
jgi:murein DD-endopeptidase MepM/ murein hydrolase activator NlpD